ncbi:MAG: GxxExxY protein [Pseudomonadota bacterium]
MDTDEHRCGANQIFLFKEDLKTVSQITNYERGQMMNYLKITGLRVGLLLNFLRPKLEWERVAL